MLIYEIVTRTIPFGDLNPMQIGLKVCLESARPPIPAFVPNHLQQLMTLCWQEEPTRRPKAAQVATILEKMHG